MSDDRADEQCDAAFILKPILPSYGTTNAIEAEESKILLSASHGQGTIKRTLSACREIAIEETAALSKYLL